MCDNSLHNTCLAVVGAAYVEQRLKQRPTRLRRHNPAGECEANTVESDHNRALRMQMVQRRLRSCLS